MAVVDFTSAHCAFSSAHQRPDIEQHQSEQRRQLKAAVFHQRGMATKQYQ